MMKVETEWYKIVKDGELYIFSTTICASSIGVLLFEHSNSNNQSLSAASRGISLSHTLTACSLLFVLIISTAAFALASYLKLKEQSFPDEKLYSAGSVGTAIVAALLGYVTFVQGG